ncbi:MAG: hypothetical protein ACRDJL_09780 [Actinomycetota bacterium]
MKAYVLVQTADTAPVAGALKALRGVVSADDLRGPYDAIALANSVAAGRSLERIVDEIRGLPGVVRAITAPLDRRSVAPSSSPGAREDEAA